MNRQSTLDGLHLNHNSVVDKKIQAQVVCEPVTFVFDRYLNLSGYFHFSLLKFQN